MKIDAPLDGALETVADRARFLEDCGYDGLMSSETAHDPFLPLAVAAGHTSRVELVTAIAVEGPFGNLPAWLDEGTAVYAQGDPETFGDELHLRGLVVDKQHIGVAVPCLADSLAGADGDDADLDSRLLGEKGQHVIVKAGVLGRGCRRHGDELLRRLDVRRGRRHPGRCR